MEWANMGAYMGVKHLGAAALIALTGLLVGGQATAVECTAVSPFINEIDYDHDANVLFNHDRDEFVEIAAPAGTDLTGYRIVVIEGSSGVCFSGFGPAGTAYIDQPLSGAAAIVGDENGQGMGFVSVCFTSTSTNVSQCDITVQGVASDSNLKNGSLTAPAGNCADGVLLLDPQGNMVDAIGYEGQVQNTGPYGQYFQPGVTGYFLYPPVYDDGYGNHKSVARTDSAPARATSVAQWAVSGVNGATPSASNAGQALACTSGPVCGDGNLDAGEACDDGNLVSGDGCSDACVIEVCGDGIVHAGLGEACDDGNMISGDGCSDACVVELCGDGVVQPLLSETCDDGNTANDDGCSDSCQVESCGDGSVQVGLGEQCDDGGTAAGDGCNASCQDEFCGDGVVQAALGEACDDGNAASGDGCDDTCQIEVGVCGNGLTEFGEDCDDANQIDGDGCSSVCTDEPLGVCGDGVQHPTEGCDDGNFVNGDGCDDLCQFEVAGVCGDAVVHPTEACDDGANGSPFDGCTDACTLSNAVPATGPVGMAALAVTLTVMGWLMLVGLRRSDA